MILLFIDLDWLYHAWYIWVAVVIGLLILVAYHNGMKELLSTENRDFAKREKAWPLVGASTDAKNSLHEFMRQLCMNIEWTLKHTPDTMGFIERKRCEEFLHDNHWWEEKYEWAFHRMFIITTYLRMKIIIVSNDLWDEFWEWYKERDRYRVCDSQAWDEFWQWYDKNKRNTTSIIVLLISTVSIIALCAFCLP